MQTIIGKEFPEKVIPLFDSAKSSIHIIVFDWRWYPDDPANPAQLFNASLVRAISRGVIVSALVNSKSLADTLRKVGVDVKVVNTKNLMHAKIIIIDEKDVVIGSHNYTQSAFTTNFEFSVLLDDGIDTLPFLNFFNMLCQL